jgi:hypothetical protein
MSPERDDDIPTLTDVVDLEPQEVSEETIAALHSELTARVLELAEELVQDARRDMEVILFERVRDRLRDQLPDLIDAALRERLAPPSYDDSR